MNISMKLCVLVSLFALVAQAQQPVPPRAFDPGPVADPSDAAGAGYAEIFSSVASFRELGLSLEEFGKFRPAFGPTFYRGPLGTNQVKILVIGQDATHIAEAAGRTFTGGTGGRLQGVVDYLGVPQSSMFINTFAYTILGQFGDFVPVIDRAAKTGRFSTVLPPSLYLLAAHPGNPRDPNDPISPVVEWRNRYLDQIIDANRDSLKLILTVGGAARDTLAAYINSRGGRVPTDRSDQQIANLQLVKTISIPAGGNHAFSAPVDSAGNSLCTIQIDLRNPRSRVPLTLDNFRLLKDQRVRDAMAAAPRDQQSQKRAREKAQMDAEKEVQGELARQISDPAVQARMAPQTSGPFKNGFFHAGQMGYNLGRAQMPNRFTSSLQGLNVRGRPAGDIRFVEFPHPGSLSPTLRERFQQKINTLNTFIAEGWRAPIDPPAVSQLNRSPFTFDHDDIPRGDFPLGKTHMVISDSSNARRNGANIIQFGGRDKGEFDLQAEEAAQAAVPFECLQPQLRQQGACAALQPAPITGRDPRTGRTVLVADTRPWEPAREFDAGPGALAQLFNVPKAIIDDVHRVNPEIPGRTGIRANFVKESIDHGFHGVFRGTLKNPPVLVLADPFDMDDMFSSRALSGAVGQSLHGLLAGVKFNGKPLADNYVVISTVPFDMTGAVDSDWKHVLEATNAWRQGILTRLINPPQFAPGRPAGFPTQGPSLIITLGARAQAVMAQTPHGSIPVVNFAAVQSQDPQLRRAGVFALDPNLAALQQISRISGFQGTQAGFPTLSLPRTHFPFGMQYWVGTSGTRVLRAQSAVDEGVQYEVVAPRWVLNPTSIGLRQPQMSLSEQSFVRTVCTKFQTQGFTPCPGFGKEDAADRADDDADAPDPDERAGAVQAREGATGVPLKLAPAPKRTGQSGRSIN